MTKDYMAIFNLAENENDIRSLTTNRSIASIPIASRFRIVDFMLSNVVNGGITNVGVFSHSNSRSLVDHIGDGKPWDLNRKNDGLFVFNHGLMDIINYESKLLKNNMEYLYRSKSENVILTSSYMTCNMDIADVIQAHEKSGCDVTVVYTHTNKADTEFQNCYTVCVDEKTNRVTGVGKNLGFDSESDICMEVFLLKKSLLIDLIYKNARVQRQGNFYDALFGELGNITINAYRFDGYVACINSISSYYRANMEMLRLDVSSELFRSRRPVYTKIKDEPPTIYVRGCNVSNSLIADGCIIRGSVKNSVIGRFVEVEEGAVVENCIILQNIRIKANAKLHNVIVDKNVTIDENTELRGNESFPLVIEKKNLLEAHP